MKFRRAKPTTPSTLPLSLPLPQSFIDAAYEADAANALAEYGAQFRSDVASFLDDELIDQACRDEIGDLPPRDDVDYFAFCDPSGGGHDAMCVAVAHHENGKRVIDALRIRAAPFSPQDAVAEFSGVLTRYGIRSVTGDRYGAEWVAENFRKAGFEYRPSELAKSDIYREAAVMFSAREIEIPPVKRLLTELRNLERRVGRSGRDIIDHSPRGHDDAANAVCGALLMAEGRAAFVPMVDGGRIDEPRPFDGFPWGDRRGLSG